MKRWIDPPKREPDPDTTPASLSVSDMDRAVARNKSYTGAAIITFILYWLLWLPGLVVNFLYYREAKNREQVAGTSLPGVGCLTVMLWANLAWVALFILILLL